MVCSNWLRFYTAGFKICSQISFMSLHSTSPALPGICLLKEFSLFAVPWLYRFVSLNLDNVKNLRDI